MTPSLLPRLLHPTLGSNATSAAPWLGGAGEDGPGGSAFLRALSEARQAASPPPQAPPGLAPSPAADASPPPEPVREPSGEAGREPERAAARPREARGARAEGTRDDSAPPPRAGAGQREATRGREGQEASRPDTAARQAATAGRRTAASPEAAGTAAAGDAAAVEGDESFDALARTRGARGASGAPGEPGVAGIEAAAGRTDPALAAADAAAGPAATPIARGARIVPEEPPAGALAATGPRSAKAGAGAGVEGAGDAVATLDRSAMRRASAPRAGDERGGIDIGAPALQAAAGALGGAATALASGAATHGAQGAELGTGGTAAAGVAGAAGATPFAGALVAAAGSGGASSAPVREAGLAAAPGSEAFARELGVQVSVFVRDGVQQARLHLNPQELGPVQVTIQLEGQAAHVRMAAEVPSTREALEQALPSLAGQLSEAGFTLAGGGVFERSPEQPAERGEGGSARPTGGPGGSAARDDALTASLEPGRWSPPRGLVDLLA